MQSNFERLVFRPGDILVLHLPEAAKLDHDYYQFNLAPQMLDSINDAGAVAFWVLYGDEQLQSVNAEVAKSLLESIVAADEVKAQKAASRKRKRE